MTSSPSTSLCCLSVCQFLSVSEAVRLCGETEYGSSALSHWFRQRSLASEIIRSNNRIRAYCNIRGSCSCVWVALLRSWSLRMTEWHFISNFGQSSICPQQDAQGTKGAGGLKSLWWKYVCICCNNWASQIITELVWTVYRIEFFKHNKQTNKDQVSNILMLTVIFFFFFYINTRSITMALWLQYTPIRSDRL